MRSLLLAAVICAVPAAAAARRAGNDISGELQQPDGVLLLEAPPEIRTYDEPAARRRLGELDRAIAAARDPIARATLLLERATLRAAEMRHERLAWLTVLVRRDEAKDPAAKQALAPQIASRAAAAARASDAAIADLTELACDPGDRGRGFACRAPAALRTWPALDDALFQLAYLLSLQERDDDAAHVYRRIVDDHPGSRHRGDALVAAADRAFERTDLATAESLYRAVPAAPGAAAALRAYAEYKLGWVHLNLGRGKDAFASFAATAAIAGPDPRSAQLVREARRDLARAFAAHGAPADAFAAFEAAAPGEGVELLARLATHWLDIARDADAIAVLHELSQRAPADPRRCTWQLSAARAAELAGPPASLVFEIEALATVVDQTRGLPSAASCAGEARGFMYEHARRQLRAATRLSRAAMRRAAPATSAAAAGRAEHADRLFAAIVRAFPADPDRGTARLSRAEAAFLRAEEAPARTAGERRAAAVLWRRAADRFDEAIKTGLLHPGERSRAAEARTLALRRAVSP